MYTISRRVSPSQTDAQGRLKFVSALDMMQDCSLFWEESEPLMAQYFQQNGIAQFLMTRQVDVLRMPNFREELSVATGIYDAKPHMGYRNTVIYDAQGLPCFTCWGVGTYVNKEKQKIVRIPREVLEGFTIDEKVDMEYANPKIFVPQTEPLAYAPVPVRKQDIDINGHMNNSRYIELLYELLPECFQITRMRVEYRLAAQYGNVLHPFCYANAEGTTFTLTLCAPTGEIHMLAEFTGR